MTASASRNAIAAVLAPSDIFLDLDVPTKTRALEAIARFVGVRHGLLDGEVCASLGEREEIGSTALGLGVAIPHARVKGLTRPIAAFVRMKIPIPFDAPDGKPVSDLFVLLVPQHATETHLLLLRPSRGDVLRCVVSRGFAQLRPSGRGAFSIHSVATVVNDSCHIVPP